MNNGKLPKIADGRVVSDPATNRSAAAPTWLTAPESINPTPNAKAIQIPCISHRSSGESSAKTSTASVRSVPCPSRRPTHPRRNPTLTQNTPETSPHTNPIVAIVSPMSRPSGTPIVSRRRTSPIAAAVPCPPANPVSIITPKAGGTGSPKAAIAATTPHPTAVSPRMMIHTIAASRTGRGRSDRPPGFGPGNSIAAKTIAISVEGHDDQLSVRTSTSTGVRTRVCTRARPRNPATTDAGRCSRRKTPTCRDNNAPASHRAAAEEAAVMAVHRGMSFFPFPPDFPWQSARSWEVWEEGEEWCRK